MVVLGFRGVLAAVLVVVLVLPLPLIHTHTHTFDRGDLKKKDILVLWLFQFFSTSTTTYTLVLAHFHRRSFARPVSTLRQKGTCKCSRWALTGVVCALQSHTQKEKPCSRAAPWALCVRYTLNPKPETLDVC